MRALGVSWRWLGIGLVALASCRTPPPVTKPPREPEAYRLPPESDIRFASTDYPKEAYKDSKDADPLRKASGTMGPNAPMGGPFVPGAVPGQRY
jgi:hypothetical protein